MLAVYDALPPRNRDIHEVFKAIIKGDCDFKVQNRVEQKQCDSCKQPLKTEEKWLLELPMIFTLSFQYPDIDLEMDRPQIRKLYNLLQPKINLSKIYKVSGDTQAASYVMRGMIVYYGRHYWAYFYSQKFDAWFQFDDAKITRVGNFTDVVEKCVRAKAIPRTIFMERQDILVNMLMNGEDIQTSTDLSKIYCSDSQIQVNNFWKQRKRAAS